MSLYEDALARRAVAAHPQLRGGSGYFAARSAGLDPSLFDTSDHLLPEVRRLVLNHLLAFWGTRYAHPAAWATVWLAGSGITTAWNAERESGGAPGDLDCLIGIDYARFYASNPAFQGFSEAVIAHHLNNEMHAELWPSTARTRIGHGLYELTYYVNPGGSDIRAINPYAAYDVSSDQWTVRPVEVPTDFSDRYFSDDDRNVVLSDANNARGILDQFQSLQQSLLAATPGSPHHVSLAQRLHDVVKAGAGLFDNIHDGRKAAFAPGGKGYFDVANYRWQAGKASGAVPAMRDLKQLDEAAHRDMATPEGDTGHLLLLAALANGGR